MYTFVIKLYIVKPQKSSFNEKQLTKTLVLQRGKVYNKDT